ncbi:MAG TPA: hypothetical protein H9903_08900 [Candidatus Aquabacterium excrementipullorum]|nr:hypothetical protein [Candidatus Aquabacterium excrementipullorum]
MAASVSAWLMPKGISRRRAARNDFPPSFDNARTLKTSTPMPNSIAGIRKG